jgi:hypothetical protein
MKACDATMFRRAEDCRSAKSIRLLLPGSPNSSRAPQKCLPSLLVGTLRTLPVEYVKSVAVSKRRGDFCLEYIWKVWSILSRAKFALGVR